jgi:hypothetical protein
MDRPRVSSSIVGGSVIYQRLNSQQKYVTPGLVCLMVAVALERITFYIVTTNMTDFFVDVVNDSEKSGYPVTTYLVFTGRYCRDHRGIILL